MLLCPAGWVVGGEWRFIYCEENVVPKNAARQIGNYGPKLNSALHILARFMAAASLTTHTHHTHYSPSGRDKPHIYRSKFFIRIWSLAGDNEFKFKQGRFGGISKEKA